ncbi:MAG: hypothetical protein ACJAS3_003201 [Roseivirga sp.]
MARVRVINFSEVKKRFSEIESILMRSPSSFVESDMDLVKHLKGLIIEYKSRESKYSMLDR